MLTGLYGFATIIPTQSFRSLVLIQKFARKTIKHLPLRIGFAITRSLAAKVTRLKPTETEAEALKLATSQFIGRGGRLKIWSWGDGPVVVLVHGWGGCAANMAPLALQISRMGFRAVTFDVSGHGESPEPQARWEWFIRDIGEVARQVGPVYAFVGHSAGGLSLMASRRHASIGGEKFICVCAPSHPHPPIQGITQRLDPGDAVLDRYRTYLASQFGTDWNSLKEGWAYQSAGTDLLLIYDQKDRYIPHSEGNLIQSWCPGSTLQKTLDFGHTRILGAAPLAQMIGNFLSPQSKIQSDA
jgi:predicted alpha/beta-fold hydrolase